MVALLTGEDLKTGGVNGIRCGFAPTGAAYVNEPPRPALAQGAVRFVGDMVALVIAETLAPARDAAEMI